MFIAEQITRAFDLSEMHMEDEALDGVLGGRDIFGQSGFGTPIATLGVFEEVPESDAVWSEAASSLETMAPQYEVTRSHEAVIDAFAPTEFAEALRVALDAAPETVRCPIVGPAR